MSNDLGRSETVTFLRGDDEAKLRELDAEVERSADDAEAHADAIERRQKFAVTAEKRGTRIILRSVGRKTWRRLINAHPPREDADADKVLGANADTFPDDLVPACMVSPTFANDEEREAFLDNLSEAQFGQLAMTAFALNMSVGANPKARPE